jgi:periplasmic copper chaperone A
MSQHFSVARRHARTLLALVCLAACDARVPPGVPGLAGAWLRPTPAGEMASIYLTVRNPSDSALVLTGVAVDGVAHSTFHESTEHAGMSHMSDRDSVTVPAHDSLQFAPRGLHLMAHGVPRALALRDSVAVRIQTRSAGTLTTWAVVQDQ